MVGEETKGTQVKRPLPDARQASPRVATVTLLRKGGNRGNDKDPEGQEILDEDGGGGGGLRGIHPDPVFV